MMKKLLGILVLGLLWCGTANAEEKKISPEKKERIEKLKTKSQWPSKVDWGCLNICKDAIKGVRISEINSFCMMQCSLK
jgi:hypothetical protein